MKRSGPLAKRHMDKIASSVIMKGGKPTDQDMLGEVLASTFVGPANHCNMFPSWLNHSTNNHIRPQEILQSTA